MYVWNLDFILKLANDYFSLTMIEQNTNLLTDEEQDHVVKVYYVSRTKLDTYSLFSYCEYLSNSNTSIIHTRITNGAKLV